MPTAVGVKAMVPWPFWPPVKTEAGAPVPLVVAVIVGSVAEFGMFAATAIGPTATPGQAAMVAGMPGRNTGPFTIAMLNVC